MNRFIFPLAVLLTLTGCALPQGENTLASAGGKPLQQTWLALFSSNPSTGLPKGWKPLTILRTKKPTQYQLVNDGNKTVLYARAVQSSSALMHEVNLDPDKQPWLSWQWKISHLLKNADNTQRATEDSPVRIVLGFDGDKESLPFADQVLFETAKAVTGHDFPYATLMYIWENKAPVGTVIRSNYSNRIKMMVAVSGPDGIGKWHEFTRNIVEDYQQAFGEKPGRLIGIGVLTDTDNTGETVEAWYGDIRLLREPRERAYDGKLDSGLVLRERQ